MIVRTISLALSLLQLLQCAVAFSIVRPFPSHRTASTTRPTKPFIPTTTTTTLPRCRDTSLASLVDVPFGFFTLSLPVLGVILSISRHVSRTRLEERAWEQRLAAAQKEMLEQNVADTSAAAMTELDVRRQYAAMEWSAYGGSRGGSTTSSSRRTSKTTTAEPPYDPYYDEPYPEDELPEDRAYTVDRVYGDRVYEDGEIFYKDADTGMYYRQGCKPRGVRFFP